MNISVVSRKLRLSMVSDVNMIVLVVVCDMFLGVGFVLYFWYSVMKVMVKLNMMFLIMLLLMLV